MLDFTEMLVHRDQDVIDCANHAADLLKQASRDKDWLIVPAFEMAKIASKMDVTSQLGLKVQVDMLIALFRNSPPEHAEIVVPIVSRLARMLEADLT